MYVYYEHHRAPTGAILLTELRISSHRDGRLAIDFFRPTEKLVFNTIKPLLKWPPLSNYSYAPDLMVWSYFGQYGVSGTYGEEVIKKIQTVIEALQQPFKAIEVEDLVGQAPNNRVDLSGKRKPKMSAEEFFYSHGQPVAQSALTREQLAIKLGEIFGLLMPSAFLVMEAPELKRRYRAAAMRLHPDRNNGDSKGMTELNFLWQEYQRLTKENTNAGA